MPTVNLDNSDGAYDTAAKRKERFTLQELAQGRGGGLAVDVNLSVSGDDLAKDQTVIDFNNDFILQTNLLDGDLTDILNEIQQFDTDSGDTTTNTLRTIEANGGHLEQLKDKISDLDKYALSDLAYDAPNTYYGHVDRDGGWYIMRASGDGVTVGEYRYKRGDSGYVGFWANRAVLPYDYFYNWF